MQIMKFVEPLFESNAYVLLEDGYGIVIDPHNGQDWFQFLSKSNIRLECAILTHEHYDHVSGLKDMRIKYPQCKVIASKACSDGLLELPKHMQRTFKVYMHFLGKDNVEPPKECICEAADICYEKEIKFDWHNNQIYCHVIPGHSKGSAYIRVNDTYVFSGDSLLKEKEIVTKFLGGDPQKFREDVMPIFKKMNSNYLIMPGHGDSFVLKEKIGG
ncbi:MAG: MBL fold metallo-hydrolase [Lachnospiraceae bacterium]